MDFRFRFNEVQTYPHYINVTECTQEQYEKLQEKLQGLMQKSANTQDSYDNTTKPFNTRVYGVAPEQVEEILDDLGIKYSVIINRYEDPESIDSRVFIENISTAKRKSDTVSDNESSEHVTKPKKYYIHLDLSQSDGYLNRDVENNNYTYYFLSTKEPKLGCQTQFTKDEIARILSVIVKIDDENLEEVKGDED